MKKQIRRCVFETNSSSTHSLSILSRNTRKFSDIPKNSEVIIDGTYTLGEEIFDELGKLNHIVIMLASIVEIKCDFDELEVNSFETMIELDWFKWLTEAIEEESNTKVIYKHPLNWRGEKVTWIPFYDTTYDEDETVEYIFTDGNSEIMTNKEKFKERVKDIVYNKEIIIMDKEDEW